MRYVYIYCYWQLFAKMGILSLGYVCYLQLITKLRIPLQGQVASYSLFLSWGSRCWNKFAIYSFAKLWVPAGTRANHAAVGGIASCQHGGMVCGQSVLWGLQVHIFPRG